LRPSIPVNERAPLLAHNIPLVPPPAKKVSGEEARELLLCAVSLQEQSIESIESIALSNPSNPSNLLEPRKPLESLEPLEPHEPLKYSRVSQILAFAF
jgi:hypothetical protein